MRLLSLRAAITALVAKMAAMTSQKPAGAEGRLSAMEGSVQVDSTAGSAFCNYLTDGKEPATHGPLL